MSGKRAGFEREKERAAAFRYYELVVETSTMSSALLALVICYPLAGQLRHKMLQQFYFPTADSVYFVIAMGCSDLVQVPFRDFELHVRLNLFCRDRSDDL